MEEEAKKFLDEAQALEQNGQFWEASEKYQQALLRFNKLSKFTSEKSLCKQKIREMNQKRSSDFKEVSVNISSPMKTKINYRTSLIRLSKSKTCLKFWIK